MSTFTLHLSDTTTTSQEKIITEQLALFNLLQIRDSDFTLDENIILEYPAALEDFLNNPINYIKQQLENKHIKNLSEIKEIVILTTYGDKLIKNLVNDGFDESLIDMPAGPDNTYHFSKQVNPTGTFIYYLEVVNEADEKIRPTFIITAKDNNNEIIGGISGNIFEKDNQNFAYIATTVTAPNAPQGLGSQMMQETLNYLEKSNVVKVNAGTQTADKFYIKHGFNIINHLINNIRYRSDKNNNKVWHDLVILEKQLTK